MSNPKSYRVSYLNDHQRFGNKEESIRYIEPMGLGTGDVECMTSYLTRLSNAHWLQPTTFIKDVLFKDHPDNEKFRRLISYNTFYLYDGIGNVAERAVSSFTDSRYLDIVVG